MTLLILIHLALTWAMVGLIWTIQLVQYPLFGRVDPGAFRAYHAGHTQRISLVVVPLMLGEVASAAGLLVLGLREPCFLVSLLPLTAVWLSTWLLQVPLHEKLAAGFEAAAHRRLVRTNWIRTVAWSLRGVLLLATMSAPMP